MFYKQMTKSGRGFNSQNTLEIDNAVADLHHVALFVHILDMRHRESFRCPLQSFDDVLLAFSNPEHIHFEIH